MVLQKNELFSGSVRENLRWGNESATDEEIREACRLACADEFILAMPDGYDSYIEQGGTNVSGGQKQRVAIAGIIAMRPKCIVMDEPTAMLDPAGRKEVMATVRRLNEDYGITIILITHYMEEAAQCRRVIVMDKGRVLLDDTPREVFSKVELIKSVGLDVPQVTELVYELNQYGLELDGHIITEDECADMLIKLIS